MGPGDQRRVLGLLRQIVPVAALSAVFAATVVVVVGLVLGYRPMLVSSDALGGELSRGSLAVIGPRAATSVAVGDVLAIDGPSGTVVPRRVVEIELAPSGERLAITRGDQNLLPEGSLQLLDGPRMAVRWVIPGMGRLVVTLASPLAAISFTVVVLAMMIWALRWLWSGSTLAGGPVTAGAGRLAERRRPSLGAKGAVALLAANGLFSAGAASALFTSSDSVVNNQFGTSCFDASVANVQTGQITNSVEGTQVVTLGAAVDPSRSLLFTSLASDSVEPADSAVLARLASATQVELIRQTDAAGPENIDVHWTVVEYGCGVTVQRGDLLGNGSATMDVTIAPVTLSTSFVITSAVSDRADSSHDGDDDHLAHLHDATTLRLSAPAGGTLPTDHRYGWQVVSFDDPGDLNVQTATQTLSATDSETITLGAPVDPETTMVLAHAASLGVGTDIGERMVRVHLSSATTVEVTRLLSGDPLEVSVQVVEFSEGTVVQHGVINLGVGQASAAVSVNPVDSATAAVLSTVARPGSLSGGATDLNTAAVIGEASATFELTDPTTVTVSRSAVAATASFGWQLIEWGGPNWWDGDYPFRQRIDVTTSTVGAPDGYTVPLTFDHAALVAGGFAAASGDDLRVLRWDGSAWSELHRVLDDNSSWNAVDTTFWFSTSDAIATASTDSYWLYFGDETPPPPLDDPEQVWLLFETFDSGGLGDFEDRTGSTAWYQAEPWSDRIPLTIQSSQVDATLSSFPVLVQLVDAGLGSGAQSDGDDIRFTAADGTTALPHELEFWDSATGSLSAWVEVPTVSSSVDTTIYLYYGAADAPRQHDPYRVWSDAEGIWHLSRDPSGAAPQLDDSSSQRRDGLSSGSMTPADLVSGQVGEAIDFDGADDRLDAEPFDLTNNALTVSAWVNLDSVVGEQLIVGKADDAATRIFTLSANGSQARLQLSLAGSTYSVSGGTLGVGTWHQVVGTWDGTTMAVYVDGTMVDLAAPIGALDGDGAGSPALAVSIGDLPSNEQPLDGRIDEVRLELVARPTAWLTAAERNQSTPGSFVVAGATQSGTWFDQGTWSYRKPLAIDGSFVAATLTDQPVLVDFTDPELIGKLQVDGDDIVFTAADGTTRLDHKLDSLNAATGSVTAWVRVPTVAASSNTDFFIYYGNATAVSQQSPQQVFGPDADLVLTGP